MAGRAGRKKIRSGELDEILLVVILILVLIGVVMVFSSSAIIAQERYNNMYFFAFRQALWVLISLAALFVGYNISYKKWAKFSKFGMIAVLLLLVAVLVPYVGYAVKGARRWIRLAGMGFQPAEFAKIIVIVYMASTLDRKFSKIETFYKDLLPPLILVMAIVLLIYMQPDFGTSALIVLSVCGMLFLGGVRVKHLIIGIMFFIPFIAYGLLSFSYRRERLFSFLKPFENMYGSGFQLSHSLMALGDGGLKGVGLGSGYQKLFFIPEVHTDFVFAIIGQELGYIGAVAVLVLFVIFMWRGIVISIYHKEYLGRIMAAGLTFLISVQAVINIAVVTGCLPTKGLSLPFVSFGGSSLLFNMLAVGILLNISKEVSPAKRRVVR
jgi:cell division protein FtsW